MGPRVRPGAALCGAALLLALGAGHGTLASDTVAPSTERMARRLRRSSAEFRQGQPGARPFFSANAPWTIPAQRERLAAAGDVRDRINLGHELAQQLLWAGRNEEALAELDALSALGDVLAGAAPRRMEDALRPLRVIAHLRLGEQRNCIARHNPESCLMPLRGRGVHAERSGSERAIELLSAALDGSPDGLAARWLLNLAYMTTGGYPDRVPEAWLIPPEAFASEHEVGRFPNVAIAAGADLTGLAGGSALEDFDGDGDLDIAASSWGFDDQLRYLENRGDGRFVERSAEAGLTGIVGGLNLSHADYDGDGDADLLVLRGGWLGPRGRFPPSLLQNDGRGRFRDVTEEAGLLVERPGQTGAWADYDGDGRLDLFLGHESSDGDGSQPCSLFHNDGDGGFSDVAVDSGLADLGWVKGAAWGDYDNDGRPDLYVSRLGQPNLLFHNDGPGAGSSWRFTERARHAGVQEPGRSFPTWFFDYDNDGWLDIFVAAWDGSQIGMVAADYLGRPSQGERPRLYRNRGDGRFEDVTRAAGLHRVLLVMGANFGDIDNDGFEDVYLGTGAPELWTLMPNRMFRNRAGRYFQDVTTSGGFGHLQKGHGVSFGDLDGDGDQDVYAVMGGWFTGDAFPNALFLNPGHGRRWITLRLVGVRSNRSGVGARIRVVVRGPTGTREIHRVGGTGGSFGSSSLQQEIGLGDVEAVELLEVRWPASGRVQSFHDVATDRVYRLREDAETLELVPASPVG